MLTPDTVFKMLAGTSTIAKPLLKMYATTILKMLAGTDHDNAVCRTNPPNKITRKHEDCPMTMGQATQSGKKQLIRTLYEKLTVWPSTTASQKMAPTKGLPANLAAMSFSYTT
jgi:hypothetical protein